MRNLYDPLFFYMAVHSTADMAVKNIFCDAYIWTDEMK